MNRKSLLFTAFCLYAAMNLVSMATMNIFAVFLLVLSVISSIASNRAFPIGFSRPGNRRFLRRNELATLGLLTAFCLSLAGAYFAPVAVAGVVPVVHAKDFLKAWYFFLPVFWFFGLLEFSSVERRRILAVWFVATIVLAVLAVAQYYTGWPREMMIVHSQPFRFHAILFLGHHLTVASVFLFPFFMALDCVVDRNLPNQFRQLAFCAAISALTVLFLSYSRMVWIGLPVGIIFWGLFRLRLRSVLGVVLVVALLMWAAWQSPKVQEKVHFHSGIDTRIDLWQANWEFFKMRPLIGVGFGKNGDLSGPYLIETLGRSDVFAGHAHNNVLEILAGLGLIGILAWSFWWGMWFFDLLNNRTTLFSCGLLAALLVYHLNGLTQVNFWEGKVLHQLMWGFGWMLLLLIDRKALYDH